MVMKFFIEFCINFKKVFLELQRGGEGCKVGFIGASPRLPGWAAVIIFRGFLQGVRLLRARPSAGALFALLVYRKAKRRERRQAEWEKEQ